MVVILFAIIRSIIKQLKTGFMKTTILISLLCFSAMGSYAQSNPATDEKSVELQVTKDSALTIYQKTNGDMGPGTKMRYESNYSTVHAAYPDAPANAVPAKPSGDYVALQDPPC